MIVYFCMGNWPPAGGYEGDLIFASRNSENVTCDPCTWPSRSRETSPKNAYACDAIYTEGWIKEIRNEGMPSGWSVLEGRKKKNTNKLAESIFTCIGSNQKCVSRYIINSCCATINSFGLRSMVSGDRQMPHIYTCTLIKLRMAYFYLNSYVVLMTN